MDDVDHVVGGDEKPKGEAEANRGPIPEPVKAAKQAKYTRPTTK
ncbi:hypothetical protein [Paraburkholderia sp. UCT31]|nr:hypothetical protein [Paraburkholderia sp. UCT31]